MVWLDGFHTERVVEDNSVGVKQTHWTTYRVYKETSVNVLLNKVKDS